MTYHLVTLIVDARRMTIEPKSIISQVHVLGGKVAPHIELVLGGRHATFKTIFTGH